MKWILLLISICTFSASAQTRDFENFASDFVSGYRSLKLPVFDLSYVNNLKNIAPDTAVLRQLQFFKSVKAGLGAYKKQRLTPQQQTGYALINYETNINLQRLALEQQWIANRPATVAGGGIITVPNGKAWYAYFLKRWVDDEVTPYKAFQFGLREVKRVQGHIEAIRKTTGLSEDAFYKHLNDPSFFITDTADVEQAFEHTRAIVYSNLHRLFSITSLPGLKIKKGSVKAMAQTPGYYNDNVFYYNQFSGPYNKRQVDWLFLHEAVPGHHYQISIAAATKVSPVQQLFFYYGFAEGWGAYCEELGKQLGLYKNPYDELGKWQWDIVRSVRVPMDVGLNYYGWTDQQALKFWKKNIRGQDDIAMREIARVRRWPAQCITYKYWALQLLHWKALLKQQQGKKFNIKDFHDRVLNYGSLPLFLVRQHVFAGGTSKG